MLLVTEHWGSIEVVADALLDAPTLTRDEVIAALRHGESVDKDEARRRALAGLRKSEAANRALDVTRPSIPSDQLSSN